MAKQIIYGEEARRALEKGVNQLADTVLLLTRLPLRLTFRNAKVSLLLIL